MSDNVHARILAGYEADHFWQRMSQHLNENDALGEDAASLPFFAERLCPDNACGLYFATRPDDGGNIIPNHGINSRSGRFLADEKSKLFTHHTSIK